MEQKEADEGDHLDAEGGARTFEAEQALRRQRERAAEKTLRRWDKELIPDSKRRREAMLGCVNEHGLEEDVKALLR